MVPLSGMQPAHTVLGQPELWAARCERVRRLVAVEWERKVLAQHNGTKET